MSKDKQLALRHLYDQLDRYSAVYKSATRIDFTDAPSVPYDERPSTHLAYGACQALSEALIYLETHDGIEPLIERTVHYVDEFGQEQTSLAEGFAELEIIRGLIRRQGGKVVRVVP